MSICPRVGGLAEYLDRCRHDPLLPGLQEARCSKLLNNDARWSATRPSGCSQQVKDGVKAGLHGGMLFEELGFRYIGPIDGHDLPTLRKYLAMVKDVRRARCCCTSSPRRGTASSRPRKTR